MVYIIVNLAVMGVLVGLDQWIKAWATASLAPVQSMPLIPHVVELRYFLNDGMAFSMLSGMQIFLIIATSVTLLIAAYALFVHCKNRPLLRSALLLIVSGGVGNLIDRVLNGCVVDYINLLFMRFAVFNFADICVCVGAALLVLDVLLHDEGFNKKIEPETEKDIE